MIYIWKLLSIIKWLITDIYSVVLNTQHLNWYCQARSTKSVDEGKSGSLDYETFGICMRGSLTIGSWTSTRCKRIWHRRRKRRHIFGFILIKFITLYLLLRSKSQSRLKDFWIFWILIIKNKKIKNILPY